MEKTAGSRVLATRKSSGEPMYCPVRGVRCGSWCPMFRSVYRAGGEELAGYECVMVHRQRGSELMWHEEDNVAKG